MTKRVVFHGVSDEDAAAIQWDLDHGNSGPFLHTYACDPYFYIDVTIEDEPRVTMRKTCTVPNCGCTGYEHP